MKFKFLSLFIILIAFGIISAGKVYAVSQSSILVNMAPENPAPNENVSITLSSYASNLDSVLISWSVNGKIALSGIGKKSFSLNAPGAGSETSVIATISLPDGSIDTRIIIRPAVMTLLWQANDSYVPPFYRGKALPTPGSEVKVVALPEVKAGSGIVNPQNMTYSWKKDYTNNVDGSGYAKNAFTYTNDYLENSNNIDVVASTLDQKYSSEASLDIGTYQPQIMFYKKDITLGTLWEQTVGDGNKIVGNEILQAAPYFISPADIRIPSLTFSWFINDFQIDVPIYSKNILPVSAQAGTSGTSQIKLQIDNSDKIYETASKTINVTF